MNIFPSPLEQMLQISWVFLKEPVTKVQRDPVPPNLGWKLAATVDKSHAMPAYVPGVTLSSVLAADMCITKRPLSLHVRVNGHLIVISMYSQTPL